MTKQPTPQPSGVEAAVVLAGGGGRRLGGIDKAAVTVGGVPLLDRVVAVLGDVPLVVVVGPERPTVRPVRWTREHPAGGGPAAAVGAALPLLAGADGGATVALLAADLPFLQPLTVHHLAAALRPADDGAVLVDGDGRRQLLCGVWRLEALRHAFGATTPDSRALSGRAIGPLLGGLQVRDIGPVPAHEGWPQPWLDCDTPADLAAARRAEDRRARRAEDHRGKDGGQ